MYAPAYDQPEQVLKKPKQNYYYNQQPNNWPNNRPNNQPNNLPNNRPNNPQHSTSYLYYGPQTNQVATTEKPNSLPTERGVKTRYYFRVTIFSVK